jgi:hypothetical protein
LRFVHYRRKLRRSEQRSFEKKAISLNG